MTEAARAAGWHDGSLSFEYWLLSPLFDHQGLVASAARDQDAIVGVRDLYGRKTAEGHCARSRRSTARDRHSP
jgi:3-methylfumaryl-CoA hydratase